MTIHQAHGTVSLPARRGDILAGIWRVADPKITLASVASMTLGAGAAAWQGTISWVWLALTVVGIFCIEAAKNASGEIFDWDSGADQGLRNDERTPFSGGKRVLVDGLMSRRQCALMALAFYALGISAGLAIVLLREPRVLWFGVAGVALAFFYHAPPFSLSYRGLGEAAVALAYGPIIACGTYLVQLHTVSLEIVLLSVPLGLAIMAFLWINEFPDARADAAAGKRTLVVRLGRPRAARMFALLVGFTYLGIAVLPLFGLPAGVLFGFIGLPFAFRAAKRVLAFPETPAELVPAQGAALLAFVLLAIGAAFGVVVFG
jgi:1,4-dihydroxy-2-naphthoate polyprenyltransferase